MIADRVLDGLGPGFRRNAGDLLPPMVAALLDPMTETDRLLAATDAGWAAAFDLELSQPQWLAQLVGIQPDSTLTPDEQRAIIRTRPGWAQGTARALVSSIRTALVDQRRVRIDERDAGAWHATIHVYESDFAPGVTQARIRALAERHRPVGMTFEFVFYPASSYQEAEDVAGTYATAEAAAGTYQEVED